MRSHKDVMWELARVDNERRRWELRFREHGETSSWEKVVRLRAAVQTLMWVVEENFGEPGAPADDA